MDKPISVTQTFMPDIEAYHKLLDQIWAAGQLTNNGPLSQRLKEEITAVLSVSNLTLTCNGTAALQLAIKALGLKGEVITTPYSYVATTNTILWEGCTPIFVDVDERTFCLNPELIEAAITEKTSAILATHVYGYPCDVERIQAIADRHGLKVIYDAAHAFGVKLDGRSILQHGDCSTLSFHATKLFHTGEGGAVVCKDSSIAQRVLLMGKFGHIGEDDYVDLGINAKMSELHAAMGLAVLPKVPEIIAARRQRSAWYDELLDGVNLQRPAVVEGLEYNYAYYPIVFSDHQTMMAARKALISEGVVPRRYFYPSLNTLPHMPPPHYTCPVSESVSARVLSLPLSATIKNQAIQKICAIIKKEI